MKPYRDLSVWIAERVSPDTTLSQQALARQQLCQLNMWLLIIGSKPIWTSSALKESCTIK